MEHTESLLHDLLDVGLNEKFVEKKGLSLVVDDHVCDDDAGLPVTKIQFTEAHGMKQVCPGSSDEGDKIVVSQMSAIVDVLWPDLKRELEFVNLVLE